MKMENRPVLPPPNSGANTSAPSSGQTVTTAEATARVLLSGEIYADLLDMERRGATAICLSDEAAIALTESCGSLIAALCALVGAPPALAERLHGELLAASDAVEAGGGAGRPLPEIVSAYMLAVDRSDPDGLIDALRALSRHGGQPSYPAIVGGMRTAAADLLRGYARSVGGLARETETRRLNDGTLEIAVGRLMDVEGRLEMLLRHARDARIAARRPLCVETSRRLASIPIGDADMLPHKTVAVCVELLEKSRDVLGRVVDVDPSSVPAAAAAGALACGVASAGMARMLAYDDVSIVRVAAALTHASDFAWPSTASDVRGLLARAAESAAAENAVDVAKVAGMLTNLAAALPQDQRQRLSTLLGDSASDVAGFKGAAGSAAEAGKLFGHAVIPASPDAAWTRAFVDAGMTAFRELIVARAQIADRSVEALGNQFLLRG